MLQQSDDAILVVGGAGYVGMAFCELLESKDVRFAIFDNFSIGKREEVESKRWLHFSGDITYRDELEKAIHAFNPTQIIVLAAIHFIPYCIDNPDEAIQVNVAGVQNVIQVIKQARSPIKLLFMSSAAVYADAACLLKETDKLGPIDVYGSTKLAAELFIEHQLADYKIIRLFNVYGKADPHPHLVPRLYKDMAKHPAKLHVGNIEPRRDYIHVDDVARGIYAVMTQGKAGERNILGTGKTYSVAEIVQALAGRIGYMPQIIPNSGSYARKVDRLMLGADISKTVRDNRVRTPA
jgi:UDP-glucose 4-epimerase